ncbi:MAG: hypothetical protein JW716_02410 [Candidatus Aenigmarchaeota archaeon]|nr:hypothetical protein [Candidatus Aenigmarchaeota archaeon]
MGQNYKKYAQVSNRMRKTSRNDRKSLLDASDNRCQRCGMSVRGMPTQIVYKNSDSTDKRQSNVMIVCMTCYDEMNKRPKTEKVAKPETPQKKPIKPEEKPKEKVWWKFWNF